VVETALELLKSATNEYKQAIVKGRIAKPVEYQDARGFRMAGRKNDRGRRAGAGEEERGCAQASARGLRRTEEDLAGRDAAPDAGEGLRGVLSDVSRIELSIGKLM
jgi:hypothetical protein